MNVTYYFLLFLIISSIVASGFTEINNEDLVFKIVETNNSQLFAIVYEGFSNVANNKYFGIAKNKEEAEDLTHYIFLILFVKLKTFKRELKVYQRTLYFYV